MMICCYETGGAYADSAKALKLAAKSQGIEIVVISQPDRGSWCRNVREKPGILCDIMRAYSNDNILYVDADCELVGKLQGIERLLGACDVLVRHRGNTADVKENYNIGVMLLKNNSTTRTFLSEWKYETETYGHRYETCDQGAFIETMKIIDGVPGCYDFKLGSLPAKYNVLSGDKQAVKDPVITHHKFSRQDPVVAAWKAERALERASLENLRALLKTKPPKHAYLTCDPSRCVSDADVLYLVNSRTPVPCKAAWFDLPERLAKVIDTIPADYCVTSTDGPQGNAAAYLRQVMKPKPSALQLPPKLALYYPVLSRADTFGELYMSAWFAALQSLYMRGCSKAVIHCPDGLRNQIYQWCEKCSFESTFV